MTTVALLGTGTMCSAMARRLLAQGLSARAWNRHRAKAEPLADHGATVVDTAAEAVDGADVLLTMLFDTDVTAEVVDGVWDAVGEHAVWLQSGTVGPDGTRRLADLAAEHGVGYVDLPVLGAPGPAEQGALVLLPSGDRSLEEPAEPVLAALGDRRMWIADEPGPGSTLKLVVNAWLATLVQGIAESVALARGLGVDPQLFLDAISGGPLDAGYAQLKGKAMLAREFPASFGADGALKDAGLIAAAMESVGMDASVMQAIHDRFVATVDAGHGREDMASVIDGFDGR